MKTVYVIQDKGREAVGVALNAGYAYCSALTLNESKDPDIIKNAPYSFRAVQFFSDPDEEITIKSLVKIT